MATPLHLPEKLRQTGAVQAFLTEFPLVGYLSRCRRSIKRQLKMRSKDGDYFSDADFPTRQVAQQLSELIRDHLGWPNAKFMPEDPCDLLFSASPSGMQDVCALQDICKRFELDPDALDDYQSLRFGGLVERVKNRRKRID